MGPRKMLPLLPLPLLLLSLQLLPLKQNLPPISKQQRWVVLPRLLGLQLRRSWPERLRLRPWCSLPRKRSD